MEKKEKGNDFFKIHEYEKAKSMYFEAIEDLEQLVQPSKDLLFSLYSNVSICQLKLGEYEQCVETCNNLLIEDPSNIKSLLRRAKAFEILKFFNQSLEDLYLVLKIQPNNKNAKDDIKNITKLKNNSYRRYENSQSKDPFQHLPLDAIIEIFSFLPISSIKTISLVNHYWKTFLSYSRIWEGFYRHLKSKFHTNHFYKFVKFSQIVPKIVNNNFNLDELEEDIVMYLQFIDQTPSLKILWDWNEDKCSEKYEKYSLFLLEHKSQDFQMTKVYTILRHHDYNDLEFRKFLSRTPKFLKRIEDYERDLKIESQYNRYYGTELYGALSKRKNIPLFEKVSNILTDEEIYELALKFFEYGKVVIENDQFFWRLIRFRENLIEKIYQKDKNLAKLIYEKRNMIF